jgi:hypothetical protein
VGVDRTLPREEFFYRQLVSSADFLKAYLANAHSVDDHSLAPGHPTFCVGGRQLDPDAFVMIADRDDRKFVALSAAATTPLDGTCKLTLWPEQIRDPRPIETRNPAQNCLGLASGRLVPDQQKMSLPNGRESLLGALLSIFSQINT